MAKIRFGKSINLGGGARLNLSRRGIGASIGVRGARIGVGANGRARVTASIPGTGLSVTQQLGGSRAQGSSAAPSGLPAARPSYWLGFVLNVLVPGVGMAVIGAWLWAGIWFVGLAVVVGATHGLALPLVWIGVLFHYHTLYAQRFPA